MCVKPSVPVSPLKAHPSRSPRRVRTADSLLRATWRRPGSSQSPAPGWMGSAPRNPSWKLVGRPKSTPSASVSPSREADRLPPCCGRGRSMIDWISAARAAAPAEERAISARNRASRSSRLNQGHRPAARGHVAGRQSRPRPDKNSPVRAVSWSSAPAARPGGQKLLPPGASARASSRARGSSSRANRSAVRSSGLVASSRSLPRARTLLGEDQAPLENRAARARPGFSSIAPAPALRLARGAARHGRKKDRTPGRGPRSVCAASGSGGGIVIRVEAAD